MNGRHGASKLGLGLCVGALFVLLLGESNIFGFGWDPLSSDLDLHSFPSPPSWKHWLGTDDRGRDVLARLLSGFRYSIGFSLAVWVSSYSLGVILGAFMGYRGGLWDLFGQRVIEVLETVPFLFLVMLMVSSLGKSFWLLIIVNALFGWMMIANYLRAQVMRERELPRTEAIRALGASEMRVLFQHILPLSILPALIFSPLAVASYVVTLVQLDFMGLGLQPPTPSWGELLLQAHHHFPDAWWLLVFPMMLVMSILISLKALASRFR